MRSVVLTTKRSKCSVVTLLDDCDLDLLNDIQRYHFHKSGYIYAVLKNSKKRLALARLIVSRYQEIPLGYEVDHRNRNVLDNRRENLRVCLPINNSRNKGKRRIHCSSQYKGVSKSRSGAWDVRLSLNGKSIRIGGFQNERDAAIAYDIESKRIYGEYSCPNFTDLTDDEIARVKSLIEKRHTIKAKSKNARSKYFGVFPTKDDHFVVFLGKQYIGFYSNERTAAEAYNKAALSKYGSLATLNEFDI